MRLELYRPFPIGQIYVNKRGTLGFNMFQIWNIFGWPIYFEHNLISSLPSILNMNFCKINLV
jgi:hypothetical protein